MRFNMMSIKKLEAKYLLNDVINVICAVLLADPNKQQKSLLDLTNERPVDWMIKGGGMEIRTMYTGLANALKDGSHFWKIQVHIP